MMKRIRALFAPGIRLQITLWYTCVFAILLLLVSIVSYVNASASLNANVDATLALHARQIAAGINYYQGRMYVEDISGSLPGLASTPGASASPGSESDDHGDDGPDDESRENSGILASIVNTGTLVRILDTSGNLVYTSLAARNLPALAGAPAEALSGKAWYETVTASGGQPVRLYNLPISTGGLVFGLLEVGTSLTSSDDTLHSVLFGWVGIVPIALLLGALGSLFLAARAFIPVSRLTRIARQVEAGDLRQRVPVPRAHDEVQELALTLNDMIASLESAFARQNRFVADASHELRTPVAAIRSMTDVALLNQKSPAEYTSVLWGINAEAERLGRLIGDLLTLARADEVHVPLARGPLRLDTMAMDVASVSSVLAEERGIVLRVETAGPVMVLGDGDRILQAALNLVHNALTYTPENSRGLVTLRVWSEGDTALFSVTDTGIGIDSDHLPHIFERFYRTDRARAHSFSGSGLGLAIVDWVVSTHGGSISVNSRVGVGSTFCIRLPLASAEGGGLPQRPRLLAVGKNGAV
jgi:two-component system, OmpR family, sensor kinase